MHTDQKQTAYLPCGIIRTKTDSSFRRVQIGVEIVEIDSDK